MKNTTDFDFDDLQALLRFGHGKLTETCFMLLNVADPVAAGEWLKTAPISRAVVATPPPETALQIAFSVEGLRALGVGESVIEGFSDEFIAGMAGDESRSRRLGDVGNNDPEHWQWGGNSGEIPHVLLLLYTVKGGIESFRNSVENEQFAAAFQLRTILPTDELVQNEPFGFADGISQPEIDWTEQQSTDHHLRDRYSNRLATGELVLGYANEYGLFTTRPLIDPQEDSLAIRLPAAIDAPRFKDFGRNGSYLVIRQLHQDVPGFWQFVDEAAGRDEEERARLAASMVGRKRDGTPLVSSEVEAIAGIERSNTNNHFTFDHDPAGHRCPIGAHIRRANPRTGDFPPGVGGFFSRLLKILGFKQRRPDEDLIASTRFHRLLRRGRGYGPVLTPEDALLPEAPQDERGLQFIVLVANISRQFEFVQNAWSINPHFAGLPKEQDPLLGDRQPLADGSTPDGFSRPDSAGPRRQICGLQQFVTVVGGGYFFMPGLKALEYIAASPSNTDRTSS